MRARSGPLTRRGRTYVLWPHVCQIGLSKNAGLSPALCGEKGTRTLLGEVRSEFRQTPHRIQAVSFDTPIAGSLDAFPHHAGCK